MAKRISSTKAAAPKRTKRPTKNRSTTPPSPTRKPKPPAKDKVSLSTESRTTPPADSSARVSRIADGLSALDRVSAADHAEWGGQTTDASGEKVIKPGKTETDKGRVEKVGEYWDSVKMKGWDGNTDQPWSSAYISSLHERAGIKNFKGSIRHSHYISEAIKDKNAGDKDAPYHGHRVNERAPKPGDLLCWTRSGSKATYDNQQGGKYPSHCDRVQSVQPGSVTTLGGNVGDSVSTRTFTTDKNGLVNDPSKNFIAVLAPQNLQTN